jgi:hypothetical protein
LLKLGTIFLFFAFIFLHTLLEFFLAFFSLLLLKLLKAWGLFSLFHQMDVLQVLLLNALELSNHLGVVAIDVVLTGHLLHFLGRLCEIEIHHEL